MVFENARGRHSEAPTPVMTHHLGIPRWIRMAVSTAVMSDLLKLPIGFLSRLLSNDAGAIRRQTALIRGENVSPIATFMPLY